MLRGVRALCPEQAPRHVVGDNSSSTGRHSEKFHFDARCAYLFSEFQRV